MSWEEVWYPPPGSSDRHASLRALSWPYAAVVSSRNWMFDRGLLRTQRVPGLRVVSIGNLNVGGTGKTPAVLHLVERALTRHQRVAVLSRGHGRTSEADTEVNLSSTTREAGDEPLLLKRRCPEAIVLVGSDRAKLAHLAKERHGAALAILDDGFQHRRLGREVDIVVVDATAGFGNGCLLPRGPLREPLQALRRASLVWMRVDAPDTRPTLPFDGPIVVARQRVAAIVDEHGRTELPAALSGLPVVALAGIARPARFTQTLSALGAKVVEERFHPDHHPFTPGELEEARAAAEQRGARLIVTEKDSMRLPQGFPVSFLRWETEILEGEAALQKLSL